MNEERKRFSEAVIRELVELLGKSEPLRKQLEGFPDLPARRVAVRLLSQFENLLSPEVRGLFISLIEQDMRSEKEIEKAIREREDAITRAAEETRRASEASRQAVQKKAAAAKEAAAKEVAAKEAAGAREAAAREAAAAKEAAGKAVEEAPVVRHKSPAHESIMEHFGAREAFPTEPMDVVLNDEDWIYIYGFSYAPEASGKGIPTKRLTMDGFDRKNKIFLIDHGDVRFYASRLTAGDFVADKSGKPGIDSPRDVWYRYDHEKILNILRAHEVIVGLKFWRIVKGIKEVTRLIEDKYVDILRTLIDAQDATEWEVEVFAYDDFIIQLPIISADKGRTIEREGRATKGPKARDARHVEKLIFREKSIAQEIHSNLMFFAQRGKLDHMIRIDSAFMNDWKSILVCRYTVPKDKRRKFCEGINTLYEDYRDYNLMISAINPSATIRLQDG